MRAGRRGALPCLLACMTFACSPVGSRENSAAPIGVLLESGPGLPNVEMAITTRPANAADDLVEPIASAVHAALVACHAESPGASDDGMLAGVTLSFAVRGRRLEAQGPVPKEPLSACLSRTAAAKTLPAFARAQALTLRLRTATTSRREAAERSANVAR
jgi:hypothetical protein